MVVHCIQLQSLKLWTSKLPSYIMESSSKHAYEESLMYLELKFVYKQWCSLVNKYCNYWERKVINWWSIVIKINLESGVLERERENLKVLVGECEESIRVYHQKFQKKKKIFKKKIKSEVRLANIVHQLLSLSKKIYKQDVWPRHGEKQKNKFLLDFIQWIKFVSIV